MTSQAMRSLAILVICALPVAAQAGKAEADSAKGAAILARHIAAVGGEGALRSITESHAVMTSSANGSPAPGGEVRQEIYVKAPNLVYMKMNMPPIGQMELGFDGKTAWSNSAATGPVVHEDVPESLTGMAKIGALPLAGARISYAGRREIGGRTYDAVRTVFPDSQVATFYFDVKTGLMSGMDPEAAPPPPAGRMTLTFEDYKRFGRILQATRTTTLAQGQELVVRTVSVSYAPIDRKIFDPPPALRPAQDKQPRR